MKFSAKFSGKFCDERAKIFTTFLVAFECNSNLITEELI